MRDSASTLKKREAQNKVVALVAQGSTIAAALKAVGRTETTHYHWRMQNPSYARALDAARLGRGDKTLAGMDFVEFRKLYFDRDTPWHHMEMIKAIEASGPDETNLVLAFPEAAKTQLLVDYICYLLGPIDPNYRIAVISESASLATTIVGQISDRMTDDSRFASYIDAFGPFKAPDRSRTWNQHQLKVLLATHDEKEYSLEARGCATKIYGLRFDLVICDDIQSLETLNETQKRLDWIRQSLASRLTDRGRIVMIGSRVGDGDVYEKLLEEDSVHRLVRIPALREPLDKDAHYSKVNGKVVIAPDCPQLSNWPEHWSMERFARKRDIVKEAVWTRTYMQQTYSAGDATFTDDMIEQAKDSSRGIGRGSLGTEVAMAVDPALETGTCAFMVCAQDAGKLWVLDAAERGDMFSSEDIMTEVSRFAALYKPSTIIIEQNNFQKALFRDQRLRALATLWGCDLVSHQTSRNKLDPVMGVAMMSSSFVDGEISLPWGDDQAQERMESLVDELRRWRPRKSGRLLKQDLVMALWMVWVRWQANRESSPLGHGRSIDDQLPAWMGSEADMNRVLLRA